MTPEEIARRDRVESMGHDFTDWRAQPIDNCNFCHVKLDDPKAEQQCDIPDKFKNAVLWKKRTKRAR
jgi:hypothetical protein